MRNRDPRESSAVWWTEQLNELLASASASRGVRATRAASVERLGEAVDADFGVMIAPRGPRFLATPALTR